MRLLLIGIALPFLISPLQASEMEIHTIPRLPTEVFRTEGLVRGGKEGVPHSVSLRSLKSELRAKEGGERWTLEFTQDGKPAKVLPTFQIKMIRAESFQRPDGVTVYTEPPKIILYLRNLQASLIEQNSLMKSVKKSRFVKEIIPYPAIEDGDIAIEMILSREALISPFHPRYAENRIVLDLK